MTRKSSTTQIGTDPWVPDPKVLDEFGITSMTMWRWDRDPELIEMGWALPVKIRRRNFRSRKQLEQFKANMLQRALQQRTRKPVTGGGDA